MPSIYQLKPAFQNLLRPLLRSLVKMGITANQVTIFAMVLSLFTGLIIVKFGQFNQIFFIIPIVLFLRMALNAIDGMLAREFDMKSPLGAILNELGDVISDAALYLPFALFTDAHPTWIVLIVVLTVISEMTGVVALQIGASRRYDGPMGKSDRAFVFGLLAIFIGIGVNLIRWLPYVYAGINTLLIMTIINRARNALKEISC